MGYRYIGSKARIADIIVSHLDPSLKGNGFFIDAFSGTGIVASKAADMGWKVHVNDMMYNATVMSEARLLSKEDVTFSRLGGYEQALHLLQSKEKEGFIWREYSPASFQHIGIERKYFSQENARRIDGIVDTIHQWLRDGEINRKEYTLLVATLQCPFILHPLKQSRLCFERRQRQITIHA